MSVVRWLVALWLALGAAAPALAADTVIGTVPGYPIGLTAWGGHAVFATVDEATGTWTLMQATATGVAPLGVPTLPNAPQADVGPDAAGHPVVVYRRCTDASGADCRIYELALDAPGAREQPVAELDAEGVRTEVPTIWKGRFAFARLPQTGSRIATIYVQRSPGSSALERLAGGTVPACRGKGCYSEAYPQAMKLGPGGLALVWHLAGGDAIPQEDREVWRIPLDGSRGRLLDVGIAGECGFGPGYSFTGFASPSIAGPRVAYLRVRGDCFVGQSSFAMSGPDVRSRLVHRVGGGHLAYAAAREGGRWWWVRGPKPPNDEAASTVCEHSDCALVVGEAVAFRPVHVPAPQPPLDETLGAQPLGGPLTPVALHRYLRGLYAIFRAPARPADTLPALARRNLGTGSGSRFLAAIRGYGAYVLPQHGSDLCLVVTASSFEQHDCEPAVLAAAGRAPADTGFGTAPANVFPRLVLPGRRLLFMALLPDGAGSVSVGNEAGYRHVLHPYRNFVARILPGSQATHRWTLRWTRRGKRHVERFS